ncbi:MAG: DNA-binding response regulator [Nitrospinota bacterium]|nr:MAG: DNA-binding response regulator [Nitrospinota bacterium]
MHILIAEDDPISCLLLETTLRNWGYEVTVTANGNEAWQVIQQPDPPLLAILDWMMPGMDGLEVCQKVRATPRLQHLYLLLLTAKNRPEDIVAGLEAGADDYITKPFNREELRARVRAGIRIVELQQRLTQRVQALEEALSQVKQLQGLLPICTYCKKIRDDQNYWQQVEDYIARHSEVRFSHAICPRCYENVVKPELARWKETRG